MRTILASAMLILSVLTFQTFSTTATARSMQGRNRLKGVSYIRSETSPDPEIEKAIRRAISADDGGEIRYYYNRVDLNGDGNFEAIVHLVGAAICGTGGCDTLIFQPARGGYRLISTIGLTNTPIIVSTQKTRGWSDLIVYVSGGGILPGHYVALHFKERTYPENPTVLPALGQGARISGKAFVADEVSPGTGITLPRGSR